MEETERSRSRRSSGQAGRLRRCNLPVVARRAITKRLRLLAKNKDAGLPGEAHFLDLAIFADQQGVVAGLGAPVFPAAFGFGDNCARSEEHTSELQSRRDLVCRLLLEKKKK